MENRQKSAYLLLLYAIYQWTATEDNGTWSSFLDKDKIVETTLLQLYFLLTFLILCPESIYV